MGTGFDKGAENTMRVPLSIDLKGKTAVVTGAGGVLCSMFSKAVAACGAKVALLDLNEESARKCADEIRAEGGTAKAWRADVLDRDSLEKTHASILAEFGPCDILINGAGGNSPRATTADEFFQKEDLKKDTATFFNLDPKGVGFVFNLNFLGTMISTQVFAQDMPGRELSLIHI